MIRHLTGTQATLLIVMMLAIGCLVILVIYALHKALEGRRAESDLRPRTPREANETAFASAALQSLIAQLREQLTQSTDLQRAVERRADDQGRLLGLVLNEIESGVLVFDREGFLTIANPAVRSLLSLDTWSRRRYPEVLGAESPLVGLIQACFESGQEARSVTIELRTSKTETGALEATVLPLLPRSGSVASVVCLLRKRG